MKKPIKFVRINDIDVQYNKNWSICDVPGHPDLTNQLRGRQLITLAPNEDGKLVRTFTNVVEEIYEKDNNQ
jgi:hypothetical protein